MFHLHETFLRLYMEILFKYGGHIDHKPRTPEMVTQYPEGPRRIDEVIGHIGLAPKHKPSHDIAAAIELSDDVERILVEKPRRQMPR